MAFDKNQFAEIIEEFKVDGTRLHEVAADNLTLLLRVSNTSQVSKELL